ncbi:serine/threonine-protein kinase [Frigoriglobus tundricola]|uniref:Protein kinase domain-containing protein n=1 Tax=Frigoriglobus tundricola TaxID=2774151 RepID=A0A6M5YKI2_9BACT|nr:serine/threonine-protein kinase [Frigoriglobus tundricola]QJW93811.1 hypothetical protein FTUN_1322 [Frigoriglobus tundricola]
MSAHGQTRVDELAAEFLAAVERGDPPHPAEWLARHPAHAAELAAFLADLGRFGPFLGLPALPPDLDRTAGYSSDESARGSEPPADRFGEYELVGVIGEGAMGVVHRAILVGTSLTVALKRLKVAFGDADASLFLEEVTAQSGLRHPNIVPVYHVGERDGRPYFTMPLVTGGGLDRQVGRFRDDVRGAAELIVKVARAVHHAHQRQVIHRDLKPANILLDETGEPFVADFGLAARLGATGAADAGPAGSLPWMAPEAVRGGPVTTGVDVWALGAILYELITGVRPFRGATRAELRAAILDHDPPPPRGLNRRVPPDLDAVCRRCLEKKPERRYESASAVALELERWLQDRPVRARTPTRREQVARWCRHNPAATWGGLLLVALLVGGVGLGVELAGEQAAALRSAVCRSNEHTAWHVAGSVLRKLDDLAAPVSRAADDERLRAACRAGKREAVEHELGLLFTRGAPPFETVYVLDPAGTIVALIETGGAGPPGTGVVGRSFPDRDYFTGARKHARESGRERVHVSRVFRSVHDQKDKFAISCPLRPGAPSEEPWVLAATITTDDTLGLIKLQDGDLKTALLVPRDPSSSRVPGEPDGPAGYLILVHDAFGGKKGTPCAPFPVDQPGPVPVPNGRPELSYPVEPGAPPFPQNSNYHDPVADHGHPRYAGRWLTGAARVGNTEMVVIVQQREDVALAPQRAFFERFAAWAGGVAVVGLLVFAALAGARARRTRGALREEK